MQNQEMTKTSQIPRSRLRPPTNLASKQKENVAPGNASSSLSTSSVAQKSKLGLHKGAGIQKPLKPNVARGAAAAKVATFGVGKVGAHRAVVGAQKTASTAAARRSLRRSINTVVKRNVTTGAKPLMPISVPKARAPAAKTTRSTVAQQTARPKAPARPQPASHAQGPTGAKKQKRAAWDYKGRLEDMEKVSKATTDRLNELASKLEVSQEKNAHSSAEVSDLKVQLSHTQDQMSFKVIQYNQLKQEHDLVTEREHKLVKEKHQLTDELVTSQQEVRGLKEAIATLTAAQVGLKAEMEAAQMLLEQANRKVTMKDATIVELEQNIQQLQEEVAEQKAAIEQRDMKIISHISERRWLHNTIQELKGNIRVFCRVRPPLGDENKALQHISFPDCEAQNIIEIEKLADCGPNESALGLNRNNKFEFRFDKVFNPNNSQADVFEEISQLVQSALDGYNVCIFAYGQTGSGKTYTMEGPNNATEANVGMIYRSMKQIFDSAKDLAANGWHYTLEAEFLEIYNETIRDLLAAHTSSKDEVKHEIKLTSKKKGADVTVTNMTVVPVTSYEQVPELLHKASVNRAVAATNCNERSSRSHSVFRLKIAGHNTRTEEKCEGILNLIDLAGSERLKESGSEGARLKETKNINKSLADLGNVIMALAKKDSHIPYRNSKLTHLLQNCLGGQSKTLMFVNVSPREECFSETLNSLRFATKVNNCHIGTAQKKIK